MSECSLTPAQWQQYIITSLTVADPCAKDALGDSVALFWAIMRPLSGCDNELNYLLARRESLKLLMGCAARAVDTNDRRTESHTRSQQNQRSDGWSQAQSTNQSVSFGDSVSKARYDDAANGQSRAQSQRVGTSQSRDDSTTAYDDSGSGASTADASSTRTATRRATSSSRSDSTSSTVARGSRRGCDYQMTQNKNSGNGIILSGIAGFVNIGGGYTSNASTWDRYMSQYTAMDQTDKRNGDSERHVHGNSSDFSSSTRTSSSYFNALIDSRSSETSQSESHDTSSAVRDAQALANGAGQGVADAKSKGSSSAQATSQSHEDGEAHRLTTRTGFTIGDDVRAHQRFEHLRDLYDQTTVLIDLKRKRLRAGRGAAIGRILIQSTDGSCVLGNVAAVGAPCGAGGCR